MKKLNFLLMMLGLVSLTFMASCTTEEDENPPILTISPSSDQELVEGETLTVSVTAAENPTSKKALQTLTITLDGATLQTVSLSGSSYENDFEFTVPAVRTAAYVYEFTVTDRDGATRSRTLNVTSVEETPATTPLGSPTSFTWERCGSGSGTGLSQFGLAWTSNSGVSAIITTSSDVKLVILASSDWTDITTKEDLADAVDSASGVTSYTGVSVESSQTYNDVIATNVNNEYYIIRVENGNVSNQTCGTRTIITGNYKN